ncbi:MAG: PD-(D/E)XK nuclease-like domain-containing protein [Dehalococcoidia bacterium]
MTARILDITPAAYHADARGGDGPPSLSSSLAGVLLARSPLHAHAAHPRLGGVKRSSTEDMDEGTIVHALVLGKGVESVAVIDGFDNFKKAAAQELRDAAIAAGKTPVLARKFEEIRAKATRIRGQLAGLGLPLDGVSELAIEWTEETESGPIVCRAMLDHVRANRTHILDLKKCRDASIEGFTKSVGSYGYDVQAAAYTRALAAVYPETAGRAEFLFAAVELDAPYAVGIYNPAGDMREIGLRRWRRACELWGRCLRDNEWPGYGAGFVGLPRWMAIREEEAMLNGD